MSGEEYEHGLEAGDHVIRWSHIALYPIQIHGIVLSAGPGLVTLCDCGLTSRSKTAEASFGPGADDSSDQQEEERVVNVAKTTTRSRRLVVITLTEEKEIRPWRKVDYGESIMPAGKLRRLFSSFLRSDSSTTTASAGEDTSSADTPPLENVTASSRAVASGTPLDTQGDDENDEESHDPKAQQQQQQQQQQSEKLPTSDSAPLVLARIRYLLEFEHVDETKQEHSNSVLPRYHLFYSNSECIAVWCKTGTFSTLQAAVFLHSTALGQAKSAATLALFVSSQTVPITTTMSAGGIMGWFGATTSSTALVPLLTTQPWLIPALAGYGIAAVGAPYWILVKAKGKWEESTQLLNDGFWGWADPHIFVEAIQCWSHLPP
mmetsp:Transcript_21444/g.38774  ORF Transcript_21444/g.38774 Transcript_21444/m.38774 type:complete len:376 (-) Transcript_21444:238-1365(-)